MSATTTKDWSAIQSPNETHDEQWITCPKCHRPTPSTSFFCIHESTLIAFTPNGWLTTTLILAPTIVGIFMSIFESAFIIYLGIASSILLYQITAFRMFREITRMVFLWGVSAFVVVGVQAGLGGNKVVTNIGVCGYFFVFGALILRRALRYLDFGHNGFAIALSATSCLVTFYSLSLEFVALLNRMGLGPLWLSGIYTDWFFWIMSARLTLLLGALVVLAIKASNEISAFGVSSVLPHDNLLGHMEAQLRQWADSTFAWAKMFWQLFLESLTTATRLAVRFLIEEVAPAFAMLGTAAATLWMSFRLTLYITNHGSAMASVALSALSMLALSFTFGYLEVMADRADSLAALPSIQGAKSYWYGAITDTRMLFFYVSYVIPLTALLLWFIHRVTLHFNLQTIFPGFGFFFYLFASIFCGAFVWGYFRNRKSRGPVAVSVGRARSR